eukprot:g28050.t1
MARLAMPMPENTKFQTPQNLTKLCVQADRFSYSVRKVGEALSFEQVLPNGQKVAGMLTPEDPQSPWLRSELRSSQGLFGELRIHFDPDEQVLVSQVRPAGRQKWGDERVAKRVARE